MHSRQLNALDHETYHIHHQRPPNESPTAEVSSLDRHTNMNRKRTRPSRSQATPTMNIIDDLISNNARLLEQCRANIGRLRGMKRKLCGHNVYCKETRGRELIIENSAIATKILCEPGSIKWMDLGFPGMKHSARSSQTPQLRRAFPIQKGIWPPPAQRDSKIDTSAPSARVQCSPYVAVKGKVKQDLRKRTAVCPDSTLSWEIDDGDYVFGDRVKDVPSNEDTVKDVPSSEDAVKDAQSTEDAVKDAVNNAQSKEDAIFSFEWFNDPATLAADMAKVRARNDGDSDIRFQEATVEKWIPPSEIRAAKARAAAATVEPTAMTSEPALSEPSSPDEIELFTQLPAAEVDTTPEGQQTYEEAQVNIMAGAVLPQMRISSPEPSMIKPELINTIDGTAISFPEPSMVKPELINTTDNTAI